ncbi:GntR family transcriptional regulator [Lacimonas salitolerans]|uniref:GntR family transcriptional regulator n=1 Tax=Lacimonas salitolerans TaxID=1323750 RepID=A0ABW4EHW4_9RHOB
MSDEGRGNLRQTTYDSIKMLIVTGQLPPGSRVTEADLASTLNVSRTPVREALSRLERDGFVLPRPRNGYAVMQIDVDTVNEAFDVRDLLETQATRLATRRVNAAGRAALETIIAECDALAALPDRGLQEDLREMQIGIDLHRVIAELSGNRLLYSLLDGVLDRCQAYVWLDVTNLNTFGAAREDHREIVNAICRGDEETAVTLTRRHIAQARDNVLSVLRLRRGVRDIMAKTH